MRRRLRDVGKTVSGVLGVLMGEPPAAVLPQTGSALEPPPPPAQLPARADQEPPVTDAVADLEPTPAPAEPVQAEPVQAEPVQAEPVQAELEPTELEPGAQLPADPVLADAVDLAREAAREAGGRAVGEHLGVLPDGPADGGPVLTHCFATTDPAYVGWQWTVTLARAADGEHVTVDEVVLLPGSGALVAPAWVPWSERLQPGDLAPGDVLPPAPDDARLVPAYAAPTDDALAAEVFVELGLGRARVLSLSGRADAAERWWAGEPGPDSPLAKQAPGRCVDCGFLVPLAGGLRQAFGVCANEVAPDDGRVVALAHGCGAHSETVVEPQHAATAGMAVEDDEFELLPTAPPGVEQS